VPAQQLRASSVGNRGKMQSVWLASGARSVLPCRAPWCQMRPQRWSRAGWYANLTTVSPCRRKEGRGEECRRGDRGGGGGGFRSYINDINCSVILKLIE
jgi:hypothetical protein